MLSEMLSTENMGHTEEDYVKTTEDSPPGAAKDAESRRYNIVNKVSGISHSKTLYPHNATLTYSGVLGNYNKQN